MSDLGDNSEQTRLHQMDPTELQGNFEYRLRRLEDDKLPHRVTNLEFRVDNLQGEVVAMKEIARSIGVKMDSGITGLEKSLSADIDKLQMDQAKNQAFMKGVVWVGGGLITLVSLAPMVGEALKKMMGV